MNVNYGSRRLVVGAHYGARDWLAQRVTAALMALFTVIILVQLIFRRGPVGYDAWAGMFASQWMKVLTFSVIAHCCTTCGLACVTCSWTTSSLSGRV